jgi:hypothetical protein
MSSADDAWRLLGVAIVCVISGGLGFAQVDDVPWEESTTAWLVFAGSSVLGFAGLGLARVGDRRLAESNHRLATGSAGGFISLALAAGGAVLVLRFFSEVAMMSLWGAVFGMGVGGGVFYRRVLGGPRVERRRGPYV